MVGQACCPQPPPSPAPHEHRGAPTAFQVWEESHPGAMGKPPGQSWAARGFQVLTQVPDVPCAGCNTSDSTEHVVTSEHTAFCPLSHFHVPWSRERLSKGQRQTGGVAGANSPAQGMWGEKKTQMLICQKSCEGVTSDLGSVQVGEPGWGPQASHCPSLVEPEALPAEFFHQQRLRATTGAARVGGTRPGCLCRVTAPPV